MAAAAVFPERAETLRVTFTIEDDTGALVTSWTTPVCQVSKDSAAFGASTNTPVEIGTSGVGYVDLTTSEMDAKAVTLKFTVGNAGAVERVITVITGGLDEIATAVSAEVSVTISDTVFGGTIPTWDASTPIETYDQLFSFLRTLTYYPQSMPGSVIQFKDAAGVIVAEATFSEGGTRGLPVEV